MVSVTSEVGRLRKVLVHEPGPEVDVMVPSMMEELLFDDILYGERAREEHGLFRRALQLLDVDAVDAQDLLEAVLADPAAREATIESMLPPGSADAGAGSPTCPRRSWPRRWFRACACRPAPRAPRRCPTSSRSLPSPTGASSATRRS